MEASRIQVVSGGLCAPMMDLRGVVLAVLDPFNCSADGYLSFDTNGSTQSAVDLANCLNMTTNGTVIIGYTADEPTTSLSLALRAALLGHNCVASVLAH